jgi:hypothetical protein
VGNAVALTATISASNAGVPKGTVTFIDGTAPIANLYSATGTATFSTNELKPGAHFITAQFAGDVESNYPGSTSQGLIQIVNDPNDTGTRTQ